ncbi:MAG: CRISPR-associated helicase Cas3', partial [Methanomicrobium sp.]|nr:CRISPR-associated helicase Cas3' [Methanomicrobium sp.]
KQNFIDIYGNGAKVSDNAAYPMISSVNSQGILSEIPVEPSPDKEVNVCFAHDEETVEKKIIEIAEKGGCACWIRNTVKDAVDEYLSLKNRGLNVLLFHARYTLGDRLDHEKEVLEKFGKRETDSDGKVIAPSMEERKGQILIATQVVEQSLDLDFDFIVSDLAPIDLIIQRAGRLWRHKRDRPQGIDYPVMMILAPELSDSPENVGADWYSEMFPGGSYVYAEHGKLWKTESILRTKHKILMPSDARELIDYVYDKNVGDVPQSLRDHDTKTEQMNEKSALKAKLRSLDFNLGYSIKSDRGKWSVSDSIQTRDGEPSVVLELWISDENRLWYSGDDSGGMLSRVSIPLRKIPDELVESQPDDHDAIRINLVNDGRGDWIIYENQGGKIKYNRELGVIL